MSEELYHSIRSLASSWRLRSMAGSLPNRNAPAWFKATLITGIASSISSVIFNVRRHVVIDDFTWGSSLIFILFMVFLVVTVTKSKANNKDEFKRGNSIAVKHFWQDSPQFRRAIRSQLEDFCAENELSTPRKLAIRCVANPGDEPVFQSVLVFSATKNGKRSHWWTDGCRTETFDPLDAETNMKINAAMRH